MNLKMLRIRRLDDQFVSIKLVYLHTNRAYVESLWVKHLLNIELIIEPYCQALFNKCTRKRPATPGGDNDHY